MIRVLLPDSASPGFTVAACEALTIHPGPTAALPRILPLAAFPGLHHPVLQTFGKIMSSGLEGSAPLLCLPESESSRPETPLRPPASRTFLHLGVTTLSLYEYPLRPQPFRQSEAVSG